MIYFLHERLSGWIKIGSARDPWARIGAIRDKVDRPLHMLATMPGDAVEERALHKRFSAHNVAPGLPVCEWFYAAPELLTFIAENATPNPHQGINGGSTPNDRPTAYFVVFATPDRPFRYPSKRDPRIDPNHGNLGQCGPIR